MALNWYIHYTAENYLNHAKRNMMNSIKDPNIQKGYDTLNVSLYDSIQAAKENLFRTIGMVKTRVETQELSDLLTIFKYGFKAVDNSSIVNKIVEIAGENAVEKFQQFFEENYLKYVSAFDMSKGSAGSINLLGFTGQHKITNKNETMIYKTQLKEFAQRFNILNSQLNMMMSQGQLSKEAVEKAMIIQSDLNTLVAEFKVQEEKGGLINIIKNNEVIDTAISTVKNPRMLEIVKQAIDIYNALVYQDITTASTTFQGEAFEDFAGLLGTWLGGIIPQIEIESKRLTTKSKLNLNIIGQNQENSPIIEIDNILSTATMESMEKAIRNKVSTSSDKGLYKKYSYNPGKSQGTVDVEFQWPFDTNMPKLQLSLKNYRKGLNANLSLVKGANLLSLLSLTNNSFISHFANLSSAHYSYPNTKEENGAKQELAASDGGTAAGKFIRQVAAIRGLIGVRDNAVINSSKMAEYFVVDDAAQKRVYVFSTKMLGEAILKSTNLNGLSIEGLILHNKLRIIYQNSFIKDKEKKVNKNWGLARTRNSLFLQYVVKQNITAKLNLAQFLAVNKLTP